MNKLKLLMLAPLALSAMLMGCATGGKGKSVEPASAEPTSAETTSIEPEVSEEPTGMTPEEIVAEIGSYWDGTPVEVETGVYGVYGAFSAASYSVEDLKGFVSTLFVPEEFELVEDWTTMEDGTESCFYVNPVNTGLEVYVYAETLIVDGEGKIVEESGEGTTEVEATCIEAYAYTVELD